MQACSPGLWPNAGQVALLDINEEAARKTADDIAADGFAAKGYACDCLSKESCQAAREQIHRDSAHATFF